MNYGVDGIPYESLDEQRPVVDVEPRAVTPELVVGLLASTTLAIMAMRRRATSRSGDQ